MLVVPFRDDVSEGLKNPPVLGDVLLGAFTDGLTSRVVELVVDGAPMGVVLLEAAGVRNVVLASLDTVAPDTMAGVELELDTGGTTIVASLVAAPGTTAVPV